MKATTRFGTELRTWDEGFDDDTVWLYAESLGPVGVVRATTWEDAWSCVVDEILSDADPDDPDNYGDYDEDGWRSLAEGILWRGNGIPSNDGLESPMAQEDLNGSVLRPITDEDEITVTFD